MGDGPQTLREAVDAIRALRASTSVDMSVAIDMERDISRVIGIMRFRPRFDWGSGGAHAYRQSLQRQIRDLRVLAKRYGYVWGRPGRHEDRS